MFTQADLDNLDANYKDGAKSVRFTDGREVELRSFAEYSGLRNMIIGELSAQSQPARPIRQVRVFTTQGFE